MLNAAPAISVGEAEGATVTIITQAGANAYLGGYRGAAGIRKNGTATKLVLTTADSSNPGTLTAVGSSYGSCPGIGVDGGKGTVGGNIVIKNGIVIAHGHDAPGIGCKDDGRTIANVTIEGGTVTALEAAVTPPASAAAKAAPHATSPSRAAPSPQLGRAPVPASAAAGTEPRRISLSKAAR